jgi:hypothetical protein
MFGLNSMRAGGNSARLKLAGAAPTLLPSAQSEGDASSEANRAGRTKVHRAGRAAARARMSWSEVDELPVAWDSKRCE